MSANTNGTKFRLAQLKGKENLIAVLNAAKVCIDDMEDLEEFADEFEFIGPRAMCRRHNLSLDHTDDLAIEWQSFKESALFWLQD